MASTGVGVSAGNWDALRPRLAMLSEQECAVVLMRLFESIPQSEIAE